MNENTGNDQPEMVDLPAHLQLSLKQMSISDLKTATPTDSKSFVSFEQKQIPDKQEDKNFLSSTSRLLQPDQDTQSTSKTVGIPQGVRRGNNLFVLDHEIENRKSHDNKVAGHAFSSNTHDDYDDDDYNDIYFGSSLESQSSLESLNLILEKQRKQQLNNPFHQTHIFYPVKETNKISLEYDPVLKKTVLNHYEIIKELGHGQHGKVKLAKDYYTSKLVAIKILDRVEPMRNKFKLSSNKSASANGLIENASVKREINIMKKLHHEHIVKLIEVLDDIESRKIYLILEYCSKGEIRWCLGDQLEIKARGPPLLDFDQARKIFRDVVLGVEYLHSRGVIHRDIKPANLLLSDDNVVKISDFGVSLAVQNCSEEDMCKTVGTPAFYSPEICLGMESALEHFGGTSKTIISYPLDIWALGITLYCMLFGRLPFICSHEMELYDKIINDKLDFPKNMAAFNVDSIEYHQAQNLLLGLLEKNPYKRLTIRDIKMHPFTLLKLSPTEQEFFLKSQYQLNDDLLYMDSEQFDNFNENSKRGYNDLRLIDKSITRDIVDQEIRRNQYQKDPKNHHRRNKSNSSTGDKHHKPHHHSQNRKGHQSNFVSLPVNSSFASLDSFYIDSYAQAREHPFNFMNSGVDQRRSQRKNSHSSETPSSTILHRQRKNSNDFIDNKSSKMHNDPKLNFNPIDIPQNRLLQIQRPKHRGKSERPGKNKLKTFEGPNEFHDQNINDNAEPVKKLGQPHKSVRRTSSASYAEISNSIPSSHTHYLHGGSSYSSSTNDLTRAASVSSGSSSEYAYGYYASAGHRYPEPNSETESLPFEFRVDSAQNSIVSLNQINANIPQTLAENDSNLSAGAIAVADLHELDTNTSKPSNKTKHATYRFSSSENESSSSYTETASSSSFTDNDDRDDFADSELLNNDQLLTSAEFAQNDFLTDSAETHPAYNDSRDEFVMSPVRTLKNAPTKTPLLSYLQNNHGNMPLGHPELEKSTATISMAELSERPHINAALMHKDNSVSTLQDVEQLDIPEDILMKLNPGASVRPNEPAKLNKTDPRILSEGPTTAPTSSSSSLMKQTLLNSRTTLTSTPSSAGVQDNRNSLPTTLTNDVGVLSERTRNDLKSVDLLHSVLKRKDQD
ncbi:hypothetical protein ACO0QE_004418 [Hanseniaspora vineae]